MLYSLLYTTASLPMTLGPKAQALSYHVPTKYLFLPNSQAQSLEIPYFFGIIAVSLDLGIVNILLCHAYRKTSQVHVDDRTA